MDNRIKKWRKKRGLTMHALAKEMGTSQQQIDRLEKGKRRLTVDWMERLSRALQCDIVDLVPLAQHHSAREANTAKARVIGQLEGEVLKSFDEQTRYTIMFGRCAHITNPKLFGLVVGNSGCMEFAPGDELVFHEVDVPKEAAQAKLVLTRGENDTYYVRKNPVKQPGETIKAMLVKTIHTV